MSMNKAPFVFVSGTCKFSIPVDGEDTKFRGYFAGRYRPRMIWGFSAGMISRYFTAHCSTIRGNAVEP